MRIALKLGRNDSQLMLAQGNTAAARLQHRGEVVVNNNTGEDEDHNITVSSPTLRSDTLRGSKNASSRSQPSSHRACSGARTTLRGGISSTLAHPGAGPGSECSWYRGGA